MMVPGFTLVVPWFIMFIRYLNFPPFIGVNTYSALILPGAGIGLTYKFELPKGVFKVVLGFYDGWNKATRFMDVYIEDVLKEEAMLVGANITEKVYPAIGVEDGELEIRIARNASATSLFDDPIINAIWVYQLSQGE